MCSVAEGKYKFSILHESPSSTSDMLVPFKSTIFKLSKSVKSKTPLKSTHCCILNVSIIVLPVKSRPL